MSVGENPICITPLMGSIKVNFSWVFFWKPRTARLKQYLRDEGGMVLKALYKSAREGFTIKVENL